MLFLESRRGVCVFQNFVLGFPRHLLRFYLVYFLFGRHGKLECFGIFIQFLEFFSIKKPPKWDFPKFPRGHGGEFLSCKSAAELVRQVFGACSTVHHIFALVSFCKKKSRKTVKIWAGMPYTDAFPLGRNIRFESVAFWKNGLWNLVCRSGSTGLQGGSRP